MRVVYQPVGVGGVGDDGFWFVWCCRWNDGDCVIDWFATEMLRSLSMGSDPMEVQN